MSSHRALVQVWTAQLALARLQAGLTQRELAPLLFTNQTSVSFWETGRSVPDLLNLMAWADVLGFDLLMVPKQPEGD